MSISKIRTQINEQSGLWYCVSIAVFRARLDLFSQFLCIWLPSQLRSGFLQGVNQLMKTQRPGSQKTGKKVRMSQRCHQLEQPCAGEGGRALPVPWSPEWATNICGKLREAQMWGWSRSASSVSTAILLAWWYAMDVSALKTPPTILSMASCPSLILPIINRF